MALAADLPSVRDAALTTATSYPLPEAADLLVNYASGLPGDRDVREYRAAARALIDIQDPTIVSTLIGLLASPDPEIRGLASEVLTRTTGILPTVDWRQGSAEERRGALLIWRRWYLERQGDSQLEWLHEAFELAGYVIPEDLQGPDGVRALARLISEPQPWGYIARATLLSITGQGAPPARWSQQRQERYWLQIADEM